MTCEGSKYPETFNLVIKNSQNNMCVLSFLANVLLNVMQYPALPLAVAECRDSHNRYERGVER